MYSRLSIVTALGVVVAGMMLCPVALLGQNVLRADIRLSNQAAETTVQIAALESDGIRLQEKGKKFRVKVPYGSIASLNLIYPPRVIQGLRLVAKDNWKGVYEKLHPTASRILPLLQIKENNLAPIIESYSRALLELDGTNALRALYGGIAKYSTGEQKNVASAWLAYLSARAGDFTDVEKLAESLKDTDRRSELYALRNISLTYMYRDREEPQAAIESISVVSGLGSLGLNVYPEAVFLSGLCYEDCAAVELARREEQHTAELERAMMSARVRIGREMQKKAVESGKEAPTEQEIVASIDEASVKASVGEPPKIEEIALWTTAQDIFVFVERVFPTSRWAAKAAQKITPETRERVAAQGGGPVEEKTADADNSETEPK